MERTLHPRRIESEKPVYSRMSALAMTLLAATVLLCFMAVAHTAVAATVPQAASAAGREMDRQIAARLGIDETPAKGVTLSFTTPVDVNDLERANPLARQMQEELTRWFVQAGYGVQEIRKGANLLFDPENGEMLLTRKESLLGRASVSSQAIVAGTYVVTQQHVRFNFRIVQACDQAVLAMSTVTVPMNSEVASLTRVRGQSFMGGTPIEPTVVTLLP